MLLYLHGSDTFRATQRIAAFEAKFRNDYDASSLNIARLDGESVDASAIEVALSTPPFLAEKRLVILYSPLTNKKLLAVDEALAALFQKVSETDHVIAVVWQPTTKKRAATKMEKILKAQKNVEVYDQLTTSQIPAWIKQEVAQRQGGIEQAAVGLLADSVGTDLWRLSSEIDKLLAFSGGKDITTAMVSELVSSELSDAIFELTDAIGNRNKKRALELVSQQLAFGMHPTELVSKIAWHARTLGSVVSLVEHEGATVTQQVVAKKLGLHPFVARKAIVQARSFSSEDITRLYQRLMDIDYRLKHGEQHPELLFDLLVLTV